MCSTNKEDSGYSGGDLTWIDPKYIPYTSSQNELFIGYKYGWPLRICYWRDGYGWRRQDNDDPYSPELVAQINLPD